MWTWCHFRKRPFMNAQLQLLFWKNLAHEIKSNDIQVVIFKSLVLNDNEGQYTQEIFIVFFF